MPSLQFVLRTPGDLVHRWDARPVRLTPPEEGVAVLHGTREIGSAFWTVFAAGEGPCPWRDTSPYVYLYSVWVQPSWRDRGIGRELLEFMLDRFPDLPVEVMLMDPDGAVEHILSERVALFP